MRILTAKYAKYAKNENRFAYFAYFAVQTRREAPTLHLAWSKLCFRQ